MEEMMTTPMPSTDMAQTETHPITENAPETAEGMDARQGSQPVSQNSQQVDIPESVHQRGELLYAQAKAIRAFGGPDVLAVFENDEAVRRNVLSGRWDFADVAEVLRRAAPEPGTKPNVPPPTRAANGGMPDAANIGAMSDAQFRRLNDLLSHGGCVQLA